MGESAKFFVETISNIVLDAVFPDENKVRAEVKVTGQVGPSPLRKTEPTHKE